MGAPSTKPKNNTKAVLTASDGTTPTPLSLILGMVQGDEAFGDLMEDLNEEIIVTAQEQVIGLVRGKPSIPTLQFTYKVGNLIGATTSPPGSFLELFTKKGAYAAAVPTFQTGGKMTVDLRLTIEGTGWGDAADETVDLEDCVCSASFQLATDGNTMTISCRVLGDIVIENSANTVTLTKAAA